MPKVSSCITRYQYRQSYWIGSWFETFLLYRYLRCLHHADNASNYFQKWEQNCGYENHFLPKSEESSNLMVFLLNRSKKLNKTTLKYVRWYHDFSACICCVKQHVIYLNMWEWHLSVCFRTYLDLHQVTEPCMRFHHHANSRTELLSKSFGIVNNFYKPLNLDWLLKMTENPKIPVLQIIHPYYDHWPILNFRAVHRYGDRNWMESWSGVFD